MGEVSQGRRQVGLLPGFASAAPRSPQPGPTLPLPNEECSLVCCGGTGWYMNLLRFMPPRCPLAFTFFERTRNPRRPWCSPNS